MRINRIKIQKPIWSSQSIGLAEYKLTEITEVEIIYKDKYGNRMYPNVYKISKLKALTYPVQVIKEGIKLRIIPIRDLSIS